MLYPFQREAKEAVLRHWNEGSRAALVSLPTGAGKTILFSDILKTLLEARETRGLVLVHRDELLRQAVDKLRFVWPGVSISTVDSALKDFGGKITVASVLTLARHLGGLLPQEIVVTDEAHHAPAASWLKIYKRAGEMNPMWRHLGVTATPVRQGGTSELHAIFGRPVYMRSVFELIVEGYLCPLKGLEVRTEVSVENVRTSGGDFAAEDLSRAINTRDRNRLVVENYQDLARDRKALVYAADVAHGRALTEMFRAYKINAEWISGDTPINERRRVIKEFRSGTVEVIVNCMVYVEGYDEPSVDAVLVARPTKSLGLYVQMIGRGLRVYPGKKDCLFIDFVDNAKKHRLISMEELLRFYQTRKTEKTISDLFARKIEKGRAGSRGRGQRGPFMELSPAKLDLLVSLENLSSSVREIDLFGLNAFAWHSAGGRHYAHVNDDLTLIVAPEDDGSDAYRLSAVFPREGLYAPLSDKPLDFEMAYAMGNAYLFDYGDRNLATRGAGWRSEEPSGGQKGLFAHLCRELRGLSPGSAPMEKPRTKGEYSSAITALKAEIVRVSGKELDIEAARQYIRERLEARVSSEADVPIVLEGGSPALEAGLRRAVSSYAVAEDGDFRHFLYRLISENQVSLEASTVRISHVSFPNWITSRQLEAAREAIAREVRLYVPGAEVILSGFQVSGGEPW